MSEQKEKLIRRFERERDDALARLADAEQANHDLQEQIKADEEVYKQQALKDQDAHIKALLERNQARDAFKNAERSSAMWRRLTFAAILASISILAVGIANKPEPAVVEAEPRVVTVEVAPEPVYYVCDLSFFQQDILRVVCEKYNMDMRLPLAVMSVETGYQNVTGDGGDSVGYMQVQEKWHKDRMEQLGVSNLGDYFDNILVGCDFLYELNREYPLANALAYYNSGDPALPNAYAERVLDAMENLEVATYAP